MTDRSANRLGIDVGGTTIKAAVVDIAAGELVGDVVADDTPPDATPTQVADILAALAADLGYAGPTGCASTS